jgi:PTH1 family peptidyl-tRNA hydrolase
MPHDIYLVAGLGNPGSEYEETRHNIGFMIVDEIAREFSISFDENRFNTLIGRGSVKDIKTVLAKPLSFMNRSGPPIHSLSKYLGICVRNIIIIHDDMDLEFGRIKIKEKGGHGGHKGIQSLKDAFESGDFVRLRIGIGRPGPEVSVINHVLGRFDPDKEEKLNPLIIQARDAVVTVLCEGAKKGMNAFNRKKH